jgi:hypothetical protein
MAIEGEIQLLSPGEAPVKQALQPRGQFPGSPLPQAGQNSVRTWSFTCSYPPTPTSGSSTSETPSSGLQSSAIRGRLRGRDSSPPLGNRVSTSLSRNSGSIASVAGAPKGGVCSTSPCRIVPTDRNRGWPGVRLPYLPLQRPPRFMVGIVHAGHRFFILRFLHRAWVYRHRALLHLSRRRVISPNHQYTSPARLVTPARDMHASQIVCMSRRSRVTSVSAPSSGGALSLQATTIAVAAIRLSSQWVAPHRGNRTRHFDGRPCSCILGRLSTATSIRMKRWSDSVS